MSRLYDSLGKLQDLIYEKRMAWSLSKLFAVYMITIFIRIASGAAGFMVGLYSRVLIDEGSLKILEATMISVIFFLSELIFAPYFGMLSDRHGRKKFIMLAAFLGISFSVLLLAANQLSISFFITIFFIILFAEFLAGISSASNNPALWAIYGHEISSEGRGQQYGIYTILNGGGLGLGWIIGGILWDSILEIGFLVLGTFYIIAALICIFFYQEKNFQDIKDRPFRESFQLIQKENRLALFIPVWLILIMVYSILSFSVPILLTGDNQNQESQIPIEGLSGIEVAILMITFGSCLFLGTILWGRVSDVVSRRLVLVIGSLSIFFGSITLFYILEFLPNLWTDPFQFPLGLLWIIEILFVLGCGGLPPAAMAYVSDLAPEYEAGNTLGLFIVFYTIGSILGSAIGGLVIDIVGLDWGLQGITLMLAGLSILSTIGIFLTVKEKNVNNY